VQYRAVSRDIGGVKLSVWAEENGVSYRAALSWCHAGTLPVPARQLATGTAPGDPS
jgi:putative resolvase